MKFDDLLREIGEFGPFQKRVYFLAASPAILLAFEAFSVVFIFYIPDHRCALPGYSNDTYFPANDAHAAILNATIPYVDGKWDKCHVINNVSSTEIWTRNDTTGNNTSMSTCDHWVFDHSEITSTIPTDLNVVCDRSVLRAKSNTISETGTIVGGFICGFLADRFGRKLTFYISGMALIGGGFGIAFVTDMVTLNICRFVLAIARMSTWINALVIGMEIVGPSMGALAGMVIEFAWCAGEFLLLLMAFFVRDWRYLEISLSVPSIALLSYWWFMPESPRWLASRGREDEARQILEKVAASNKTKLPVIEDMKQLLEGDATLGFFHVFKSRELVLRMIVSFSNI